MPDPHPHLRVVAPGQDRPRQRRGPGPGVLVVLAYSALFGAGLWWFRSRSPLFRPHPVSRVSSATPLPLPRSSSPEGESGPAGDERQKLARGEGLIGAAREEYLQRIATERCPCGCDVTLERCLAIEKTCPVSPPRAAAILEGLR